MKSNDILVNEHKNILKMLKIMYLFSEKCERENAVDTDAVMDFIDFVKNYADKFHHGKEEDMLFKELKENNVIELMGPVNAMLMEHDEGRNFIRQALEATELYKQGKKDQLYAITNNLKDFANLLHEHIFREDNILYPASERMLQTEVESKLLQQYTQFENTEANKAVKEKYENMTAHYAAIYL